LAGLIAGVFIAVVRHYHRAVILKAGPSSDGRSRAGASTVEPASTMSESAAATGDMAGMSHDEHECQCWEPADGFQRSAFTLLAEVLTGVGYALLLVSAFALRGGDINWQTGLYWGLAGFAAFTLAPGLGLPPEVPGTEAAPLLARQVWWVATVAGPVAGLACLFFGRKPLWCLAGIALLVTPHIYGAPQPAEFKERRSGSDRAPIHRGGRDHEPGVLGRARDALGISTSASSPGLIRHQC